MMARLLRTCPSCGQPTLRAIQILRGLAPLSSCGACPRCAARLRIHPRVRDNVLGVGLIAFMVTAALSVSMRSYWPYFLFACLLLPGLAIVVRCVRPVVIMEQGARERAIGIIAIVLTAVLLLAMIAAAVGS